jgi:hypothetical protein
MALTTTLALGEGLTAKFFYGSLIGGALGFLAGKISNSGNGSKLARHVRRFGEELSSDPNLSIDLFDKIDKTFSSNDSHIDYKTSRKNFISTQEDYNYDDYDEDIKEYEGKKYYKDYINKYLTFYLEIVIIILNFLIFHYCSSYS